MEIIKLHSSGQKDHLESLKKTHEFLKRKIKGNKELDETEKKEELALLIKSYKKEKRESKNNLY